jgi:hypothetical protein
MTAALLHGQAPLHLRFSLQEVRKAFNFHEIHLAIVECPAGEFSCFCLTHTLPLVKEIEDRRHHRSTSMDLEFDAIFARERVRRWKLEHEGLINDVAVSVTNRFESCVTGCWNVIAYETSQRLNRVGSADPDNGDAGR